jgi:hypothetical protein
MAKTRIKRKYQFGGDFKNWQSENKGAAAALGAGLGTIGTGLDMVTGKMDNISDTGQTINKTFGSMENAAMASGNPIAMMAGGASKLLRLPINAIVNKIKENKQDPRHDEQYDPTLQNVVANPFGMAKYGMKLYQDGGMIEAEGNETMELNTNQIKNIEGPSHNQGGVDINLKGNEEYIYSDSLGYDKKGLPTLDKKSIKTSFADKSKTIENKYKSKFDNVSQKSKEIELEMLKKDSEMMRMVKEAMVNKKSELKTFGLGGNVNGDNTIYVDNPNDPGLKAYQDSLKVYNKYQNKATAFSSEPIVYKVGNYNKIKNKPTDSGFTPNQISDAFKNTKTEKELIQYMRKSDYPDTKFNPIGFKTIDGVGPRHPVFKKPVQPIKYRNPEIVAKQQSLVDAGYDIAVDGIWGPKSQTAFDEFEKSKTQIQEPTETKSNSTETQTQPMESKINLTEGLVYYKTPIGHYNVYKNGKQVGWSKTDKGEISIIEPINQPKTKFSLGGDPYAYNQNDYTAFMKANNPNNLNLKSQEAIDYFRPLYGKELYSKYGEQGVNEFAKYKPFDVTGITQNQPATLTSMTKSTNPIREHYPVAMTPFTRNAALKDSSNLSVRDKDGQFDYEGFPKSDLRTGSDFNKTEITKGDKLQIAGMVPGLAYNLFNALKKPEKIGVQYNPNSNEAENLMENRRFDMQPYINDARLSYNTYKDNISNQSSSSATRNANLQKALSNTTSSLNKIRTMEQQTNNQYRADEAQLKQITGAEKVAARNLQEQLQTQTNAAKQMAGATAATQMGQFLSEFGKTKNQGLTNEMYAEVLRNLTSDFTIPEMKELLKGLNKKELIKFSGGTTTRATKSDEPN